MNAGAYNPGTTGGRREDLRNVLTILEPEATPFTSMVRKGPAPKSTFIETLGDTLRAAKRKGTKEGTDARRGGNKAKNRARFGTYIYRGFEEFGVTDVQQLISEKGGQAAVDDEYGFSKAKTLRELKRDFEAVNLGSQDHAGGTEESDMMTRGAFSWISSAAQSNNAVPASFRTPAAAIKSGVGTSVPLFTEDDLVAILKALKKVYGAKRTYQLIGGNNVVDTIDHFTRADVGSNGRYRVWEDAEEHEISLMVNVFDSSFGRIETMSDDFTNVDLTTGAVDDNQAGIFNMELWHMDMFDALHAMDLPDFGGGPTGYAKCMYALLCDSPKGNGRIYNT